MSVHLLFTLAVEEEEVPSRAITDGFLRHRPSQADVGAPPELLQSLLTVRPLRNLDEVKVSQTLKIVFGLGKIRKKLGRFLRRGSPEKPTLSHGRP